MSDDYAILIVGKLREARSGLEGQIEALKFEVRGVEHAIAVIKQNPFSEQPQ